MPYCFKVKEKHNMSGSEFDCMLLCISGPRFHPFNSHKRRYKDIFLGNSSQTAVTQGTVKCRSYTSTLQDCCTCMLRAACIRTSPLFCPHPSPTTLHSTTQLYNYFQKQTRGRFRNAISQPSVIVYNLRNPPQWNDKWHMERCGLILNDSGI